MRTINVTFSADLRSCINHKCYATIEVDDQGELLEVLSWGDGYSDYGDCSEKIFTSIAESYEESHDQS